jgi:hypothetical protein
MLIKQDVKIQKRVLTLRLFLMGVTGSILLKWIYNKEVLVSNCEKRGYFSQKLDNINELSE